MDLDKEYTQREDVIRLMVLPREEEAIRDGYASLTVPLLRNLAGWRGLSTKGRKAELVARLGATESETIEERLNRLVKPG